MPRSACIFRGVVDGFEVIITQFDHPGAEGVFLRHRGMRRELSLNVCLACLDLGGEVVGMRINDINCTPLGCPTSVVSLASNQCT